VGFWSRSSCTHVDCLAVVRCVFHGARRSLVEFALAVCGALRHSDFSFTARSEVVAQRSRAGYSNALFSLCGTVPFRMILRDIFSPLNTSHLTTRSRQPLAGVKSTLNFMKQFPVFATLAPASGGSAPSR
jgi:hypothetical protein